MQTAIANATELPRHGYGGNPPVMRELRDIPGRGKRNISGTQNIAVDRLEWYHAHGHIEQYHLEAGRKLQHDCELAQIGGYSSMGGGSGSAPRLTLADAKLDAMDRYNAARAAVPPVSFRLLELVVIENIGLAVAADRLWQRTRKGEAQRALVYTLTELAKHYGMA